MAKKKTVLEEQEDQARRITAMEHFLVQQFRYEVPTDVDRIPAASNSSAREDGVPARENGPQPPSKNEGVGGDRTTLSYSSQVVPIVPSRSKEADEDDRTRASFKKTTERRTTNRPWSADTVAKFKSNLSPAWLMLGRACRQAGGGAIAEEAVYRRIVQALKRDYGEACIAADLVRFNIVAGIEAAIEARAGDVAAYALRVVGNAVKGKEAPRRLLESADRRYQNLAATVEEAEKQNLLAVKPAPPIHRESTPTAIGDILGAKK